jgi:hypothetical protein
MSTEVTKTAAGAACPVAVMLRSHFDQLAGDLRRSRFGTEASSSRLAN